MTALDRSTVAVPGGAYSGVGVDPRSPWVYASPPLLGSARTWAAADPAETVTLVHLDALWVAPVAVTLYTDDPASGSWVLDCGAGLGAVSLPRTPVAGPDTLTLATQSLRVRWVRTAGLAGTAYASAAPYGGGG